MSRLRGDARTAARAAMRLLFTHFHNQPCEIARHFQISRQKVNAWKKRGYVSSPAALAADALRIPGARRHHLRPDVVDWGYVKESALLLARSHSSAAYSEL